MFLFLVEVIRMFLEYAGVNMNSLQLFWSDKPYGSSRSIIRRIGTSLPLKPCPRVHFQIFHSFREAAQNSSEAQDGAAASLADVGWIVGDPDDSLTKLRPFARQASLPNMRNFTTEPGTSTVGSDAALEKINLLENELAKLRKQIAMIVTVQEQSNLPTERRGKKVDSGQNLHNPEQQMPNMLEVLKDISKVKLRSVKKSVDDVKSKRDECSNNPTALIAAALKRKFAHRYKNDSSGESGSSDSDFKASTELPKFGQHLLKPTGKRKSSLENSSQS
ncbi:mitochondrial fission regulator 1-like isoform X3 [Rhinoraja longicauda]